MTITTLKKGEAIACNGVTVRYLRVRRGNVEVEVETPAGKVPVKVARDGEHKPRLVFGRHDSKIT